MDRVAHIVYLAATVGVFIVFLFVGNRAIQKLPNNGRELLELIYTGLSSVALISAVWSLLPLIRIHNGRLIYNYNLDAEPSCWLFVVPLLLAVSLGLSISKKWHDFKRAGVA